MVLFLSTFIQKVDKKGRVSVPVSFRNALSIDEKFAGIVVYKSFVNDCIEACGFERIKYLSETIDAMEPFSEVRDAFAATILSGSVQLSFDNEGRVILPEDLLKLADIREKACFVGKGATFEIWEPDKFTEYKEISAKIATKNRSLLQFRKKVE